MLVLPNIIALFTSSHGYVAEDLVDKLNSQVTVYLLVFFAVITGSKQNFGTPLQCMMPAYAVGSWTNYYHDFCYIQNELEMMNPNETENPDFVDVKGIATKPVYYQWVPYILLLQALFFLVPRLFWKLAGTHLCYGLEIESVIEDAARIKPAAYNVRDKATEALAEFVCDTLDFRGRRRLCGFSLTFYYVLRKWLMFLSVVLQFCLLVHLIATRDGVTDFLWGWKLLETSMYHSPNNTISGYFPTVIRCNISRIELRSNHKSTIQCVLMMNFINEKIFLLFYFWLVALAFINLLAAVEATVFLTVASYRGAIAKRLLPSYEVLLKTPANGGQKTHGQGRNLFDYFIYSLLRADGLLLLMFVYNHAGGLVTFELTQHVWNLSVQPFSSETNDCRIDDGANRTQKRKMPALMDPLNRMTPSYLPQFAAGDALPPNTTIENEYTTLKRT